MTAPGGGFRIAEGYVEVGLKDDTAADARLLERNLRRRLPGKQYLPIGAKLAPETGPVMSRLRDQLYELRRASKITPTYEARTVIDEMGRARTRYFKVSASTGTFIGEVMSKNMMKSMATMIRLPGLTGPIASALAASIGPALQVAIPLKILPTVGMNLIGAENWDKFKEMGRKMAESPAVRDAAGMMVQTYYKGIKTAASSSELDDAFVYLFRRSTTALLSFNLKLSDLFSANMSEMMDRGSAAAITAVDRAWPGIIRAVSSGYHVIEGLSDGLEESALGLNDFLTEISKASVQGGQVFRTFGNIARDAGGDIGIITASLTNLFGGTLWNEAEAVFGRLFNILGNLVSNALGPLGVGMEVAARVLDGVLTVVEPLSGVMGTWLGTVLGVTVAIRGFSSAIGVAAAAAGLLKFAPITAAMTTLATQTGAAGVGLAGWASKATGSAAAGEKVAGATNRVVGGMRGVISSVPYLGAALIAGTFAYQAFASQADDAARSVINGSQTLKEAVDQEIKVLERRAMVMDQSYQEGYAQGEAIGVITGKIKESDLAAQKEAQSQEIRRQAHANVVGELQKQMAGLDAVGQAQTRTKIAQAEYDYALQAHGPTSELTRQAAQNLAFAREQEERTTWGAERATRGLTQSLIDNQMQIMAQANADLAHRMAINEQTKARQALTDAVRQNGWSSDEAKDAQFRLEQADLRVIEATGRLAQENAGLLSETDRAKAGTDAQRQSILAMATSIEGRGNPMLIDMTRKMTDAEIQANNAAVRTSGFGYEVRQLPDGRQVLISTPGLQEAIRGIQGLQTEIRNINGKDVSIFVSSLGKGGIASAHRLATGGPVMGPGSGTSDSIPAYLSNGEHVWTAREVKAAGGHGAMNLMRKEVIRGGGGYAKGGAVNLRLNTKYRHSGPTPTQLFGGLAEQYFGSMGPGPGSGVNRWSNVVLRALQMVGQPASFLGITLRRMNQESGGNPRAINLWDINAKRGIPSKGLMQVIDPTFRAYAAPGYNRDIWDPLSNVLASMRYALRRYGSLPAAYNRKGGYDDGGLASGVGFLPKYTPQPERVLSPEQTRAFEEGMRNGIGGTTNNFYVTIDAKSVAEMNSVVDFMNGIEKAARRGSTRIAGVRV